MPAPKKTDADRLADASELLRKKHIEIAALTKRVAQLEKEDDTAEKIREEIFNIAARDPEPPAWIQGRGVKNGSRGGPITIWSDFHYGEVINPDEIGGVNAYNAKIAHERFKRLVNTTEDLSFNHMGRADKTYPGIVICLGGDMIGGDIHEELFATNDRTPQQSVHELTDMLASGIEQMATKFGRVFLPCVVGNHGRTSKRMRMKGRVFTNYDWSIYVNLARHFRSTKHVQFQIPSGPDAHFNVYGHRYMLTHGDSLGVKGGDGIVGALGPIMRGALKVGQSESHMGRDYDTLVMCHWHQYITLPGVIVNNALKGFDEYAMMSLRAKPSVPSQALWFSHPEHGITAHWQVYLEGKKAAEVASAEWVSWKDK